MLRIETVLKTMRNEIVISCIDCSSLQMYPMNSNYSKRSGQKRLNHTVQLHHIKLTSSMPFMNPFGSFSISMFGFLFILKRRSFSDQESTTSPAVRPLLLASRAPCKLSDPADVSRWLMAIFGNHPRVTRTILNVPRFKIPQELLRRSYLCFVSLFTSRGSCTQDISFSSFLFVWYRVSIDSRLGVNLCQLWST